MKFHIQILTATLDELENKSKKVYALDADKIAKESGHILSMNMVMLGGAVAVKGFPLKKEIIIDSMKANLPEKSLEYKFEGI